MIRLAALVLIAAPAAAQDRRPAPEIFVTSAMATSTAQILAVNCPVLSINPGAMRTETDRVLDALDADGFTPETMTDAMEDPSDRIAVLQDAFLAKHDLADGATSDAVCAAGLREISEGTAIGALLLEVEG
ncbi:DUF5333 family protein [Jannaschia donghaensis]|uniref:Uncharacterized protein n=1 Tax=Jannaschia donghaensis TaxID=420998 RepID=A0A0M6YI92_9RHOB|nr:DUF5333 family protein [Jannaschia donghaensis]CTQ49634.1 hypothetical protein JDO7802_01648 [Jannaschia donghaensis]